MGLLSGSLEKRKNRTGPVKACSSKQTIPRMVTVPLRLTIRRKHYSISCYLIGLCTLPRGLALPDCSRGIDVPEPIPPPVLDKSTPLSLCLSLCNTSVLNTRHIRVTLLSRTVHTQFFHSIQFLLRANVQLARLLAHSFYSNRVAWTAFQNSRVEERMVNSLRLN